MKSISYYTSTYTNKNKKTKIIFILYNILLNLIYLILIKHFMLFSYIKVNI